jgi:hypothetical protein
LTLSFPHQKGSQTTRRRIILETIPTLEGHMTEACKHSPVCTVVGVGPSNGAALVRRFAKEGYHVAMLARFGGVMDALATELPQARAYRCDVAEPAQIEATFNAIATDLGPVDALIYNAGKGVWGTVEEISQLAKADEQRVATSSLTCKLLTGSERLLRATPSIYGELPTRFIPRTLALRGADYFD